MTYDDLLPVYRQVTGLPGQDNAFNQWVQGIINASGSRQGIEGIPSNFFSTPQGQKYVSGTTTQPVQPSTPVPQQPPLPPSVASGPNLSQILNELRLDADFASLPANWQQDIAQIAAAQGLEAAGAEMARRASAPGQDPQFASARAALGRWAGKATQEVANIGSTTTSPIEQDLLDQILPSLYQDIEGDAQRRALVATLTGQATDDYNLARDALSPEENARRLQEEYAMADSTSGRLSDSSGTAAAEQLAALQQSIAAMQQNLKGEAAERAAALQAQIASFTANLDTFDATQKAALAQQIADNQKNLEQSIASQQQNLTAEVNALRGAADANSVARRAALQAEIDGLTAAQVPMAEARLASANALGTAINLGLQTTQDQLTADRARQGYLGSSSFSDAASLRETIGARQQAAGVMGAAREANAGDVRAIQGRAATEGRSIADELANSYLTLAGRQATGSRSLADILAGDTRTIGDTGAVGRTGIANATGLARQNIGNTGATQSYQDRVGTANDLQALLDALAAGSGSIASNRSLQQQGARDQGTMARQGYFDNAYTRGQGAILSRPGLSTNLAGTLTGLENYGNTGTNRSLGLLNWWNTGGQQAPTLATTPAVVDNSGNDIAGLGAGLLGAGLNVGNANNWWQKPAGAGTAMTYQDFLKLYPTSSAALG